MAYANITYIGNGVNRNFTVPFQYLIKDHVQVYVGGSLTTAYTYVTANTIQMDVAPSNGASVLIKRVTPIDSPIVDYVDGSTLQESLLDATSLQNLFASQEAFDAASLMVLSTDGAVDVSNRRIKNLLDPLEGKDAVTKDYVDVTIPANVAAAAASAAAADASAASAANYAANALTSKDAAAISETNAAASAASAAASESVVTGAISNHVEMPDPHTQYLKEADVGVVAQPYDANTAKTNTAQSFSVPQRSSPASDNDLSFDLDAKQNFTCTPTTGGTLTFTNIAPAAGQSGTILLVNGSNYAISKAATTKTDSSFLATVSATGTYRLSYYCDGTNVYVSTTGALS